jgi:hypothetical protein
MPKKEKLSAESFAHLSKMMFLSHEARMKELETHRQKLDMMFISCSRCETAEDNYRFRGLLDYLAIVGIPREKIKHILDNQIFFWIKRDLLEGVFRKWYSEQTEALVQEYLKLLKQAP